MIRTVNITFSSLQKDLSDTPDISEYTGEYTLQNGKRYLRYEKDGIKSFLKITDDSLLVINSGALSSRIEYIPGRTTTGTYQTPEGVLDASIDTQRLNVIEGGAGCVLRIILSYRLSISGKHVSDYDIEILCKKT